MVRSALDFRLLDSLPASPASRGGARSLNAEISESLQTELHGDTGNAADTDSPPSLSTGKGVGGMGSNPDTPRRGGRWYTPPELWSRIKPLAQEKRNDPTKAENAYGIVSGISRSKVLSLDDNIPLTVSL